MVWRGEFLQRAALLGCCAGLFFGVIAWLDSGMLLAGATVFVVLGVGSGVVTARRMARAWPGAAELTGPQRVAVVDAARRGTSVGDTALAPAVVDYGRALRAAVESGRLWRWLFVAVLVIAVVLAIWDAAAGSWGNLAASIVYLVVIVLEVFWWPRRQAALLANTERAAALARRLDSTD